MGADGYETNGSVVFKGAIEFLLRISNTEVHREYAEIHREKHEEK